MYVQINITLVKMVIVSKKIVKKYYVTNKVISRKRSTDIAFRKYADSCWPVFWVRVSRRYLGFKITNIFRANFIDLEDRRSMVDQLEYQTAEAWSMPAAAASSAKLASTASMILEWRAQIMALNVPSRTNPPWKVIDSTWNRLACAGLIVLTDVILNWGLARMTLYLQNIKTLYDWVYVFGITFLNTGNR